MRGWRGQGTGAVLCFQTSKQAFQGPVCDLLRASCKGV